MEKSKGVLNSARGGETHDWPGEDVMSRPAREALPQRSPPRPTPAPTGGASALSAGLGGAPLGTLDSASLYRLLPNHPSHQVTERIAWTGRACMPPPP